MPARKVAGIGEIVLDVVLKDGQPLAAVPGGSTFNAMISLGRTLSQASPGVSLVMVSQVGDDAVASLVTDFMTKNGVGTEGLSRVPGQSTLSLALLDSGGNARYEFFRDPSLPPFEAPRMDFAPGDIILFGSLFAVGEHTGARTRDFIRRARAQGAIVYYDVNFRTRPGVDLEALRVVIAENMALSDFVRASSEDIEALYGCDDAAAVYRERIAPLCPRFICTKGARPAEVFSKGVHAAFPVPEVEKVVTTIGAGDNFNAGVVWSLVKYGFDRARLEAMTQGDWELITTPAMGFSAHVCGSMWNYVSDNYIVSIKI